MTFEYTIQLNEGQLGLLCDLVEERVYELRQGTENGDSASHFWLEQLLHYYSLLKSGKNPLISWNSILGGAYPDPIEPNGWEQCLEKRDKSIPKTL